MDLALEFGQSAAALRKGITEREFAQWQNYSNLKSLPNRRMEFYLAQIALMIARGPLVGAEQMAISDFLLFNNKNKPLKGEDDEIDFDDEDFDDEDVEEARREFGYNPRN